ncbi:unnamed protein product [Rotaria sp. Silwood1]|nr:unnamed protein product [Rotaria sp. Silwood1]CAF1142227.1 unnamed protein product [Rotaria sp. Silwood1]CAF3428650.1 unnamed protein product [Rotaria sp. Silwood1]CAF3450350.1 unnamed protein product [Rotaria sp. Silwood1]CAF4571838.1 unnamed protein product [Rotaria sp. Silwood1]
MYAYVELSNVARTDSIIQSLSWMHYLPTLSSSLNVSNDENNTNNNDNDDDNNRSIPSSTTTSIQQSINLYDGWLATGNTNHIVSVTYTSIRSDENLSIPDRTNFNLRAHRTEVRLVSWNVPFQKLATVDEKGVIFVWVKHDNRWSLELINDRSHPVIDMAWSHDGRMTVICYEDGFVLVGSVTGQRYWSTVVNTAQAKISAVTWMPDVSHVILGTTSGNLILMDHHGNTTDGFQLSTQSITQLLYSCNKFYPGAPDNNALKFVNDDYILACSLDNGHILFLNNYQDQSPITVDTKLRNIKMDWSSTGEILAVGGHTCLTDSIYNSQIIFYTRCGEFLHRIHIPQTTQALSALCWAHGNERIFAACGSYVYTIWIIHKPLASMLTLCQMKIKEYLLNNSLQNIDKLFLPNNLKQNLQNYYRTTIKGFLPEQKTLRSFVCNPLKSHLRLQCTMKRIDNETENSTTMPTTTNLSGATYVLYLEYLGGLIPLLTAKRISKICPDFIIFDPQMKTNQLTLSSSSSSKMYSQKKHLSSVQSRSNTFHHVPTIQQQQQIKLLNNNNNNNNTNRSSLITNRNSIYVVDNNINNNGDDLITNRSSSGCSSDNDSELDEEFKQYDDIRNNLHEKSSKKTTMKKILKHKHNNKLCTIAANIWGTRFKFYGHSNCLPEMLGSVTYKTSFLHLQPRQMTVTVANTYNTRKQKQSSDENKNKKLINPIVRKTKQQIRNKVDEEDDDETLIALSSSKLNIAANIPIAPMSPQLQNTHSSVLRSQQQQQQPSLSINESNCSTHVKKSTHTSSNLSAHRSQYTTMATTSMTNNYHRHPQTNADSSTANSSSTSPINLSRSTSPAASIANFIRPISPPCIQVKEPLSPKFTRTCSSTITNNSTHYRHRSPPIIVPSIASNIDASTASATTTLLIDDSSGYDSSENQNNQTTTAVSAPIPNCSIISTVPESCFEPETYRNLYSFNSKQQKKLSLSDPALNQTTKLSYNCEQQQTTATRTTTDNSYLSATSLPRELSNEEHDIHTDNESEKLNSYEDSSLKEKLKTNRSTSRKRYSSSRHRMMTCTSGTHDSLTRLSPSSELDQLINRTDNQNDPSFYVMQNRPPLWNEQSQVYQLDFGGRVTLESAKNFQIEFKGKQVIQFGRIENNCYTLDFEWPFSPLQAFAVALANITQRLK